MWLRVLRMPFQMKMNFDEIDRRTEICLECPLFIVKDGKCRQSGEYLVQYIYNSCPVEKW